MRCVQPVGSGGRIPVDAISISPEINERGLVIGKGSILARMVEGRDGRQRLALEQDSARLLAMLSIADRSPVPPSLLAHVEAASAHWQRGDRALANLRLVFARLPRLTHPADADRMRLAEYLLDAGMAPDVLMEELGLDPVGLAKYAPDEPRVPAGHGRDSGRWTDGLGSSHPAVDIESPRDDRFVVAEDDEAPPRIGQSSPGPLGVDSDNRPEIPRPVSLLDFLGPVRPGGPATLPDGGPVGGRLGNARTRAMNAQIGKELENRGLMLTRGGGRLPEEYIPGTGPGTRGSTYVDITAKNMSTGEMVRVQTIDTLADGSPTPREAAAASRIQSKNPDAVLHLVRKK